ncbi:MoeA family protein [Alsobacter sp. R-9]
MSTGAGRATAGRSGGLTSAAAARQWLAERLPRAVETVPLALAAGRVAAEPIVSPRALPAKALALTDGIAVAALDTVGAGPYGPAPLPLAIAVSRGDALPDGTDAVLPADALVRMGPQAHALAPVAPGEGVRRVGEDLKAGAVLCAAGRTVRAPALAVLAEAGVDRVSVVRLRLAVDGDPGCPAVRLAVALAAKAGFMLVSAADVADVRWWIDGAAPSEGRWDVDGLALRPGGDACALGMSGAGPVLRTPARPEVVLALWLAVLEPSCLAASGARPLRLEARATGKVASTPGFDDLVLLGRSADDPGAWDVLSSGDAPWSRLAQAEAAGIIPAESEGHPPGVPLPVVVL